MRTSIGSGVSAGAPFRSSRVPGGRRLSSRRVVDEASLLADVDRQLEGVVATFGEPVAGALGPIAASGSRHRARLLLELARHGDHEQAVQGAAAVELLHLGTLVHDDIVDGSPLRRHAPTLHVALGMPVALWTADALYAEALHLADAVTPAGGLALGDALRRIADSQILEALGATTARYWDVVDGKTVSLFEATFALADESAGGAPSRVVARRGAPVRPTVPVRRRSAGHRRRDRRAGQADGQDADNQLHTLPAADLVVSADAVRERLRELSGPIVRLSGGTEWAEQFSRMTDHLLDAAGRVLDRAPV